MNVVDSSAWLEYFANGPNADAFAPAIEATDALVVPAICLYEVAKRILQQRGQAPALEATTLMRQGRVVDLDAQLAWSAAQVAIAYRLAMADAVILACAQRCGATLWTQDAHFEGLPGVEFRRAGGRKS